MRRMVVRAALVGLAAGLSAAWLSGCVPVSGPGPSPAGVARVDPEDAAERALLGGLIGATLGTGLGAIFAINPAIGAVIGVETGAAVGAAIGVATAQPLPSYRPVTVPVAAIIPGFYDSWPPGYRAPPLASQTPPPPPG